MRNRRKEKRRLLAYDRLHARLMGEKKGEFFGQEPSEGDSPDESESGQPDDVG